MKFKGTSCFHFVKLIFKKTAGGIIIRSQLYNVTGLPISSMGFYSWNSIFLKYVNDFKLINLGSYIKIINQSSFSSRVLSIPALKY